jgi:hypothetical protein
MLHLKEVKPMSEYYNAVKEKLISIIMQMEKSTELFVKNPETDFTRNRKLPFTSVLELLISMGGNSIYKELLEASGFDTNTATTSAFIQQREKILTYAFEYLLNQFTNFQPSEKEYRGFRLFAIDGSDFAIPTNHNDTETYFQTHPDVKGYNLLHANAIYDLCNRFYVDTIIQNGRHVNEHKALINMVDRSTIIGKVIIMADRNYESYNDFAHIENKGWNYIIRVKDLGSSVILSALPLPSHGEFDICFQRFITRKQTKEVIAHPNIYKIINNKTHFDYLDLHQNEFYHMFFRVIRFKITDDSYETVITNLDASTFLPDEIKKLYAMRWGIETSFRELKYTIGLINYHSKKREFIVQEIFARIIMYNFTEMITSHVVISKTDKKHAYKVNFTVAVLVCRQFLRLLDNAPPLDVEALILKNVLPVRPGRRYGRKTIYKKVTSFLYRIA